MSPVSTLGDAGGGGGGEEERWRGEKNVCILIIYSKGP